LGERKNSVNYQKQSAFCLFRRRRKQGERMGLKWKEKERTGCGEKGQQSWGKGKAQGLHFTELKGAKERRGFVGEQVLMKGGEGEISNFG